MANCAGPPANDLGSPCNTHCAKSEKTFNAFAGPGAELDGKELLKMCEDCHLICKKFTKQDVDVTFSGIARKLKKIGFEQFKDIVRSIAKKSTNSDVGAIQQKIAACDGPHLKATRAEYSKFHDDKSTFTGAHACSDTHGTTGHGGDKHAQQQRLLLRTRGHGTRPSRPS